MKENNKRNFLYTKACFDVGNINIHSIHTQCIRILETVQDFLIKLGICGNKPFSLNNDLVRLTKIMKNLVKDLKILSFQVIFQCLKMVESFQKTIV